MNKLDGNDQKPHITQLTYRTEKYSDTTWEIVGERAEDLGFVPMEFPAISQAQVTVDPMFADYGGLQNSDQERRWHMPEGVRGNPISDREAKEALLEEVAKAKELEIEKRIAEAEERGRASAMEEFTTTQNEKLAHIEQRMTSILQDLAKQLAHNITIIEKDALDLTLTISEKLIGYAVEINPEYVSEIIKEALRHSGSAKILKVRVSQEDMEFINVVGISKTIKDFDGTWNFEGDPTIRAGCVVETSAGQIDYQLDKAWERIRDSVLGVTK